MIYVLDSHMLIWLHGDKRKIGSQAARVLQAPDSRIVIPTFALAEIKYVCHKKGLSVTHRDVLSLIQADPRCSLYPLDELVIDHLPLGLDLHDGIFIGTALALEEETGQPAALLTCDERIVSSQLTRTIW
jgi:PIN domain nuclease of toxin-antitoxin system